MCSSCECHLERLLPLPLPVGPRAGPTYTAPASALHAAMLCEIVLALGDAKALVVVSAQLEELLEVGFAEEDAQVRRIGTGADSAAALATAHA